MNRPRRFMTRRQAGVCSKAVKRCALFLTSNPGGYRDDGQPDLPGGGQCDYLM